MSSYHGWTHASKEDGGTDPIPGLDTSGVGDVSWANRRLSGIIAIPDATQTQLVLGTGEVAPAQSDLSLVTNGIRILTEGIYLVRVFMWWSPFPDGTVSFCGWNGGSGINHAGTQSKGSLPAISGTVGRQDHLVDIIVIGNVLDAPYDIFGYAYQASGASRNSHDARLSVVRLGSHAGDPFF